MPRSPEAMGHKVIVLDPTRSDTDAINVLDWIDTEAQALSRTLDQSSSG